MVKVFKNGLSKICGRFKKFGIIWSGWQTISLQIFKGCLPQNLPGPFLNNVWKNFFHFPNSSESIMNVRRNWAQFPVPHNFIISHNFLLTLQNGQIHNTQSGFRGTRFSLSRQAIEIYDFLFIILEILVFWNQDLTCWSRKWMSPNVTSKPI